MKIIRCLLLLLLTIIVSEIAFSNNVQVSNTTLTNQNTGVQTTYVQFTISWENSWRDIVNWDAAWVFVKYKKSDGIWRHATLSSFAVDHVAPGGSTITPSLDAKGVFIYRDANGSGNINFSNVGLKWNYGVDGVADNDLVTVKVFAVEMVYIPQSAFYLNASANSSYIGEFVDDGGSVIQISNESILSEGAIRFRAELTSSYYTCGKGNYNGTTYGSDELNSSYPKGYGAFYCMKYEISEGQWVDFFNTLTSSQKQTRDITGNPGKLTDTVYTRNTIAWTVGDATTQRPDRACSYLSWMDGAAYADWAGLRPMTELEYEKACRGDQAVVAQEIASGVPAYVTATTISGAENGTEYITNSGANVNVWASPFTGGDGGYGPLRCGIFATASTSREQAGAGFYGVMELSGNLWEQCVTIADQTYNDQPTNAGLFDGSHGDGSLSANGNGNVPTWPGMVSGEITGTTGAGSRGASWWYDSYAPNAHYVSDRAYGAFVNSSSFRTNILGYRAVRTAP